MPHKATPHRRTLVIVAAVTIVALWSVVFVCYNAVRGRLTNRTREQRLNGIHSWAAHNGYNGEPADRPGLAALREFILDYPKSREPVLRMNIAIAVASTSNPDWVFVADTIEGVALQAASASESKRDPDIRDFTNAGFSFTSSQSLSRGFAPPGAGWPSTFLAADVDGDGTKDVVLAVPGDSPGVCLLLRHTKSGWVSHRLAIGLPVKAIWAFPITPKGPTAIVVAAIADTEYDPNMLFDVYVWQDGRVKSVLSTQIPHGWQWDHSDRDGYGIQSIRLVARTGVPDWGGSDPHYNMVYRWTGTRFKLTSNKVLRSAKQLDAAIDAGIRLFDEGRLDAAVPALNAALGLAPTQYEDAKEERSIAHYTIGLALALQGNYAGARAAMSASVQDAGSEAAKIKGESLLVDDQVFVPAMARRFLKLAGRPDQLPEALASVGQPLRLLQMLAVSSTPQASPRSLIYAAHLQLDQFREAHLTGSPGLEQVTGVKWKGGSAVLAWKRDQANSNWRLHVLAYGVEEPAPKENGLYRIPTGLWFYIPGNLALQPWPTASHVELADITGGENPTVKVVGGSKSYNVSGSITWVRSAGEFLAKPIEAQPAPHYLELLSVVESRLFQDRQFDESLAELNALETAVEGSSLSELDQAELLHEIYYHQAICYRKLGDMRRAEVILSALERHDSDSGWANLARDWLGGSGLPGASLK